MKIKRATLQSWLLLVLGLWLWSVSPAAENAKVPVNLNTATAQELATLPGIGPVTAGNIIAARPFKSVTDLQKVKGMDKAKYSAVRNMVTVKSAGTSVIPSAAASKAARPVAATGPVDLNTADQKTLEALPGVGTATAKNIVAARPFKSVEDLQKVKGINKTKYGVLKDKVSVGKVEPVPAAAGKAAAPGAIAPAAGKKTGATGAEPAGKTALPGTPININTADLKTLEALPGIGPVKAQAIIDHRPYTTPEDVMKVPGIKKATFAKIKDQIVVK